MTLVGVSGHQTLPALARQYIETEVRRLILNADSPLVGMCCLAAGADQLFARLVLEEGGKLHVVVPCDGYENTFSLPAEKTSYAALLQRADQITYLPYRSPSEDAYMAAGRKIVDSVDSIIAIWDGKPARGLGGTADVVGYARELEVPTVVVWPAGMRRP